MPITPVEFNFSYKLGMYFNNAIKLNFNFFKKLLYVLLPIL